jgi:hypothetical protein
MKPKTDLLATIQKLIREQFSDVPDDLVAEIISIEENYAADRAEANKRVSQAIEKYLSSLTKD